MWCVLVLVSQGNEPLHEPMSTKFLLPMRDHTTMSWPILTHSIIIVCMTYSQTDRIRCNISYPWFHTPFPLEVHYHPVHSLLYKLAIKKSFIWYDLGLSIRFSFQTPWKHRLTDDNLCGRENLWGRGSRLGAYLVFRPRGIWGRGKDAAPSKRHHHGRQGKSRFLGEGAFTIRVYLIQGHGK